MTSEHIFDRLSPTRLFFRCAIPNMISMAVSSLYMIIDAMFIGRFLGSSALAAANLVMPFLMISFALSDMVAVGSGVQIAIHLGEEKKREASRIFSVSTLLILSLSFLMSLVGLTLAEPLVRLFHIEESVLLLTVEFIKVFAFFAPVIMIFFALDNYLRICGRTTYSMVMNILVALCNIALDFVFLALFRWGIWSAALATCISLTLGTILGVLPFLTCKLPLRFTTPTLKLRTLGNILLNGSSEFLSSISSSLFMVFVNAALLHLSGTMGVIAFSIVMYIDSVVNALIFGMADSLQPPISYHYGARNGKRLLSLERRLLVSAAMVSLGAMCLMLWGRDDIIPLFLGGTPPELFEMSSRAMYLFSFSYLMSWFGTVASSFFTALNKPRLSLVLAFAQSLAFPLFFLLLLTRFLGLDGVWLTALAAEGCTALLSGVFFVSVCRTLRTQEIEAT